MCEHQGAVHEVAVYGHQFIVVARLEVAPGEVVVLGLGCIGREHVAQYVLLAGKVHEVLVEPNGPVARGRYLVVFEVEELVARHVVGHNIAAVCLHHGGEDDAVEHDVVLADEVQQACVLILPPLLPRAPLLRLVVAQLLGVADVADGRIEPYVEHLAVGSLYGHGDTPVEVARHGTGLQVHVEPALALAIHVGTPLLVTLQYPLLQPLLVFVERKVPVLGFLEHRSLARLLGAGVDELCGLECTSAALLALVAVSLLVAVGALTHYIAVGEELSCLLIVKLHCRLLHQLAFIVELAEEVRCKLMMHVRCGTAVYVERDSELLEALLDDIVIAVHYILRRDALLAGTLGHGHSMLVGSSYEEHLLAFEAEVTHVDVGRHVYASQVTDMYRTVGIRKRRSDGRSLEFLFHYSCSV